MSTGTLSLEIPKEFCAELSARALGMWSLSQPSCGILELSILQPLTRVKNIHINWKGEARQGAEEQLAG